MRLYEFESKELARKYGIPVPNGEVVSSSKELNQFQEGFVKAQVLANKRMKSNGILFGKNKEEVEKAIDKLIGNFILNEKVKKVLVEERVKIKNEYYVSFAYDTISRSPVLIFTRHGGIEVEENGREVVKKIIDPLVGLQQWQARQAVIDAGFTKDSIAAVSDILFKIYNLFANEDARLVEINPLVETEDGKLVAVGMLVDLDDDASYKHQDRTYPPREVGLGRELTEREISVRKANEASYQGTIKYLELDGDIGFLAAGGGGSMECMDALLHLGGRPANYAEHSGDPPREKLYALTKAILSKSELNGLWIVGAIANFTRIDQTMAGIVDALTEVKPKFPIVIRRSGPFEKDGLQLVRDAAQKIGLDAEIYGSEISMTASAKIIVEKARKFKETRNDSLK